MSDTATVPSYVTNARRRFPAATPDRAPREEPWPKLRTRAETVEVARKAISTLPVSLQVSTSHLLCTLVDAYLDPSGAQVAQVGRDVGRKELDLIFAAFRRAGV